MPSLNRTLTICLLMSLLVACGGQVQSVPPTAAPAPPTTSVADATAAAEPTTAVADATTVPASATGFPLTITDATGQEFTFDAPPKLGCMWYGCYEMLADMGVPGYAFAMTEDEAHRAFLAPNGPPQHIITDEMNPEQWAAADIDILATRVPPDPSYDALKQVAPVFFLHHPSFGESSQTGYQAYYEDMRILGKLIGKSDAAEAALARFDNTLANLKQLATPETKALQVAVLFGGDSYYGLTPSNPFCVALAEVGLGQCVAGGEDNQWLEVNAEQFLAIDPDWIVYQGTSSERTDPVWPQLKAVKAGHVYDAGNRYYCCSTRGLIHAFQEYVSHVLPDAGIPNPGPIDDFDPLTSPLVKPTVSASATGFPLTITDATGQEFTFDAPPKIGCWWAGCTEILADLGLVAHAGSYTDDQVSSPFFYPAGIPQVRIADTESPEQWAGSEVDIIIMRVPPDASYEAIQAAAPIFYLHHPSYGESSQTGYQAFIENLRIVGQLTGHPDAAQAAIERFETVLTNLKALSTPETAARRVAVLFNGDSYNAIGPGNPFCAALAEVGLGKCIGEGAASVEINAEEFLNQNPDWIIYQLGAQSYQDRNDPVWSQLAAVQAGHVYDAKGHRYYCCSTRGLIHALQEYVHYSLPSANIPDPGLWQDFDPLTSPLVKHL